MRVFPSLGPPQNRKSPCGPEDEQRHQYAPPGFEQQQ